jgi:formylglycine-generating enzyme required for sulfatase activity
MRLSSKLKCGVFAAAALVTSVAPAHAGFVGFGNGNSAFEIEFVPIGNAGNIADTNGVPNPVGSVSYEYQIGKYEVTRGMIESYNTAYGEDNGQTITLSDMTSRGGNGLNRPAVGISWNEAARFVNWLNTSQGYSAAYKFTTSGVNDHISLWELGDEGYDASNPYRNRGAMFALPTVDEWYKAAYFDPVVSTWRPYASLNGQIPLAVPGGTAPNTAVYQQTPEAGPSDVAQAGGPNAYGVVGMSGNIWEWEESSFDLTNSKNDLNRGIRGGYWNFTTVSLSSSWRTDRYPTFKSNPGIGFRVVNLQAAVPEPASLSVFAMTALVCLLRRTGKRA